MSPQYRETLRQRCAVGRGIMASARLYRMAKLRVLFAMGSLAVLAATAAGQGLAVRRLEAILQDPASEARQREAQTRECLRALHSPAELYEAWRLPAWHESRPADPLGGVDEANRALVAQRFTVAMRGALAGPDAEAAAQWCSWLGQAAQRERETGRRPVLPRQLAGDLARLVHQTPPIVRQAAAWALGQVEPDPRLAVPALQRLLSAAEPDVRLAAADGLAALLPALLQSSAWAMIGEEAQEVRSDLVQTAVRVLPAAGCGLSAAEAPVRRRCMGILVRAAAVLARLACAHPVSDLLTDGAAQRRQTLQQLEPLVRALAAGGPGLREATRDVDAEVRLLAQKAIEELAQAQLRWLREVPQIGAAREGVREDPLQPVLAGMVPAVAAATADPDVTVRRAALDALEALGALAAPAVPALTEALGDPDRSVRWSAVRILGALGGPAARPALPQLTRLLGDPDPDLRCAAVNALPHVAAGDAADSLRRALQDPNPEVRQAARAALLSLTPPSR